MMQLGGMAVAAAAGSGAVTADDDDDDRDEWYCLYCADDRSEIGPTQPVRRGISWLFGSDDDDDELQEYLENEVLRIHGDAYRTATINYGSAQTTLTWVKDNADLLEGRAYIRAVLEAYDEIDDGADRDTAKAAAADGVDDVFSTPQKEVLQEFHLLWRDAANYLDSLHRLYDDGLEEASPFADEDADDESIILMESKEADLDTEGDSMEWDANGEWTTDTDGVQYELFSGESITVPSPNLDNELGDYQDQDWTSRPSVGMPHLETANVESNDSEFDLLENESSGTATYPDLYLRVGPFDDHEYRNVYDEEFDAVDGNAEWIDYTEWLDAVESIEDARDTVRSNLEEFVDEAYDDIVDGDITRDDIQTLETMVQDASDEDPFARVNTHLALLGRDIAEATTTVELGGLETDDYDEDDDEWHGLEIEGTLHLDPAPEDPLEVGEQYTPEDLDGEINTTVTLTFRVDEDDADELGLEPDEPHLIELEDEREFTVTEALVFNDDGELEETDEINFSSGAPTETPTDYDELHDQLDELEAFQKEVFERQLDLVEELAEQDDPVIGIPDFGDGEFNSFIGLVVVGVVGGLMGLAALVRGLNPATR